MSNITLAPNAAGTATFIVASPATSTNRTLMLPDATTTLVGTDAAQTLTNKTLQGGALTLGTAVPSTSGTFVDFTGIPSWAKRVTVMFNGVSTSGASLVQVQIGSGAMVATGYVSGAQTGTTQASSTTGLLAESSGAAANVRYGSMVLTLVSGNTWTASAVTGNQTGSQTSGGGLTLSGALDRVSITTVNGTDTFDAGSINIMWEG